jgi:uncharacterized repeat protein (TIGR04076 family)
MAGPITSVTAKVISVKGTCAQGHKAGDIIKFTESGVEGRICIHALTACSLLFLPCSTMQDFHGFRTRT